MEAAKPPPSLQSSFSGEESLMQQPLLEERQVVELVRVKTEPAEASRESPQLQESLEEPAPPPMFAVVRFLRDKSVAVVPTGWIDGTRCMWPHLLSPPDIVEAAQYAESPDASFIRRRVEILWLTSSYSKAHSWLMMEASGDRPEASAGEGVSRSKFPRIAPSGGRCGESGLKDSAHKQLSPTKAARDSSSPPQRKKARDIQPTVRLHRLTSNGSCSQLAGIAVEGINHATDSCREMDSLGHRGRLLSTTCKSKIVASSEGTESGRTPESDDANAESALGGDMVPMLGENGHCRSGKSIWHSETVEQEHGEADGTSNGSSLDEQDVMRVILRELRTIRQQNKQILAALGVNNQNDSVELAKVTLPVTDLESLEELESKLALDPVFRACLIHRLSLVGGSNLRSFTAGVLRSLFTDAVGQHFSMLGKKQKKKLKDMILYDVVEQAIRSNSSYGNATSYSIRDAAGAWLKNCATRVMAAKRRRGEDVNDLGSYD